jgi:hypothetical protein
MLYLMESGCVGGVMANHSKSASLPMAFFFIKIMNVLVKKQS